MKFGLTFFKKVQKFPQKWTGKVFFSMILGFFLIGTLSVAPHKAQASQYDAYRSNFDAGSSIEFLHSTSNATSATNGQEKGETVTFKITIVAGDSTDASAVGAAYAMVAHTNIISSTLASNAFVVALNKQGTSDFIFADITTKVSGGTASSVFSTSLSGPEISPNSTYEAAIYYQSNTAGEGGGEQSFGETAPALDFYKIGSSITFNTSNGTVGGSSGNVTGPVTEASSSNVSAPEPQCWLGIVNGINMSGCFAQAVYYTLFVPTSFVLALSGQLLDVLLKYTLDSASYDMSSDGFIKVGWKLIRDICNVIFIFILLYSAISTILGTGGADIKKTLVSVIVVALLINFSLFFSGIIVDAGNILGRVFYTAMGVSKSTTNGTPSSMDNIFSGGDKSISTAIVSQFNPQNLFAQSITQGFKVKGLPGNGTSSVTNDAGVVIVQPPAGIYAAISLILAIINVMTAWMFFVVSFVFIGRVVGIWLAMVFSPIAFLSWTMPGQKSKFGRFEFGKWIGNLSSLSMVAPVFLFFLYLILKFLSAGFLTKVFLNTGNMTTMQTLITVILPFLIVWGLLNEAKKMAVGMSGEMGSMIEKTASFVGGAAVGLASGGTALALRSTLGQGAASLAGSRALGEAANKKGFTGYAARLALRGSKNLSQNTFEARNGVIGKTASTLGGLAGVSLKTDNQFTKSLGLDSSATKGGFVEYKTKLETKKKEEIEKEEDLRKIGGVAAEKQNERSGQYKKDLGTAKEAHLDLAEGYINANKTAYDTEMQRLREDAIRNGKGFDPEAARESFLSSKGVFFDETKFKTNYEAGKLEYADKTGALISKTVSKGDVSSSDEINKKRMDDFAEELKAGQFGLKGVLKQKLGPTETEAARMLRTDGGVAVGAAGTYKVGTTVAYKAGTTAGAVGAAGAGVLSGIIAADQNARHEASAKAMTSTGKGIVKKYDTKTLDADITRIDKELNAIAQLLQEAKTNTGIADEKTAVAQHLQKIKNEREAAKLESDQHKKTYENTPAGPAKDDARIKFLTSKALHNELSSKVDDYEKIFETKERKITRKAELSEKREKKLAPEKDKK